MGKSTTVIIIGGGLAGLTAGIHLAKKRVSVTLFEKKKFPHHKVCGEYVSKEILPYFQALQIPIQELAPVEITQLLYSTAGGKSLQASLPLGGYGISRFAFDDLLYRQALKAGVQVINENALSVSRHEDIFTVATQEGNTCSAEIVLGAFGKRDILDKFLNRSFSRKPAPWLGVKSHYKFDDFPSNQVGLHSFKGGYCGLSKTETGAVNVCYLATYQSFKKHKNPEKFNERVLRKNPFLEVFFSKAIPLFEQPLSIAQISFSPKTAVHDHILMLGDAAGLLHPLCGNGMAMAIHSAKIASEIILTNLDQGGLLLEKIEREYRSQWNLQFKRRIKTGKWLQKVLLNENLLRVSQNIVSKMPFLLPTLIKQTHGKPIAKC